MKLKNIYICNNCNYETSKWTGKCPSCNEWNSFIEDVIKINKNTNSLSKTPRKIQAKKLSSLNKSNLNFKIKTNIKEFDRVIGEGIIPGSVTLLSGEPGIGKSTLTLQIANNIASSKQLEPSTKVNEDSNFLHKKADNEPSAKALDARREGNLSRNLHPVNEDSNFLHNEADDVFADGSLKVLLISGEESIDQISNRAIRLGSISENLKALNEFNLETILETIKTEKPNFVIIDSIQIISSLDIPASSGSISQVRYCAEQLIELAKTQKIAILLIGHVTKDGTLAGPRALEHLVDTVLHLEGDRFQQFRILKSAKNRFGSCNEAGIFDMTEKGLIEVKNPSKQLLEGRKEDAIGSAITVAIEGTRPFLVEVQALVSLSHFGYPKRTANGFDLNRLQILIAVLEKYAKLNLQNQDVFINIVGGIKLKEPASDLAVTLAIASSLLKKPLPKKSIIYGEVGLSGELRKVNHDNKRQKEAEKLGFTNIITPSQAKEITEIIKSLK